MKAWLQGLSAFLLILVFLGLVVGSLSLTFAEYGLPTSTVIYTEILDRYSFETSTALPPENSTKSTTQSINTNSTVQAAYSSSSAPSKSLIETCYVPAGWEIYIVQPGDTLLSLSKRVNTDRSQLQFANCLEASAEISSGQQLFVPRPPYSTATPTPLPPSPTATVAATATAAATATETITTTATAAPLSIQPPIFFTPSFTPTQGFEIIIIP